MTFSTTFCVTKIWFLMIVKLIIRVWYVNSSRSTIYENLSSITTTFLVSMWLTPIIGIKDYRRKINNKLLEQSNRKKKEAGSLSSSKHTYLNFLELFRQLKEKSLLSSLCSKLTNRWHICIASCLKQKDTNKYTSCHMMETISFISYLGYLSLT